MINETFSRLAVTFFLVAVSGLRGWADPHGPNLFPEGSFDDATETFNPWSGVDADGNIHGLPGSQNAVGDDGNLYAGTFGASVSVGDLNGDGKPDLVMADSRGYIWYFPNSGTPQQAKFTQGQVIPIWLGENPDLTIEGLDNIVPRLQLADFNNDGKLGLAIGTYAGKLFYIPNRGSTAKPDFPVVKDPDRYLVNTHARGQLWCNYLAPCLYKWYGSQLLDLVMGEGTYSANSIYLLKNTNSNLTPDFNQAHQMKIVPGMGLEQLTPTVMDWNNDGKPDILCGDRTGFINLFLNTSNPSADPGHQTFDLGRHVSIGGNEKVGAFTTVTTGDLNGNKLPNLLIGTDAGTILYATNTGKLGAPDFSKPAVPLKGVNPYPKITIPTKWTRVKPEGVPNELVTLVNPQLEKGFLFPAGETTKYAMKFLLFPITDPTFAERYYPPVESFLHEHVIACSTPTQPMTSQKRYHVHAWMKAESTIQGLYLRFSSGYFSGSPQFYSQNVPVTAETTWTEINTGVRWEIPTKDPVGYSVEIRFTGQGTLYVDDLSISEDQ